MGVVFVIGLVGRNAQQTADCQVIDDHFLGGAWVGSAVEIYFCGQVTERIVALQISDGGKGIGGDAAIVHEVEAEPLVFRIGTDLYRCGRVRDQAVGWRCRLRGQCRGDLRRGEGRRGWGYGCGTGRGRS